MAEMDLKGLAAFLEYAADTGMSEWAAQQLIQSAQIASGALSKSVRVNLNTRRKKRKRAGSVGGGGLAGSFRPSFGVGVPGLAITLEVGGSETVVAGYTRKSKSGKVTKVAGHIRRKRGSAVTAGAYSDLPYANIHETGFPVIRKKSGEDGKYLTIPLTPEAEMVAAPEFPKNLHFRKHHMQKANMEMVGFLTQGGGTSKKKMINQYILAEWVKLPARYYITKAKAYAIPQILKAFSSGSQGPWVQVMKRES